MPSRLPVEQVLPRLEAALARGHAVLSAPPGSGKTTRVPLALLEAPWLTGRKILVLEPRRPAARMAARFMAGLLGEEVGETVGYRMRMERRVGPRTRVEVLTEGMLVRRLQADPELTDVGLVIFDEFHEHSLQSELGLALCLDLCSALREELRLLVMSATLDEAAIAEKLGAEVVASDGGLHPVAVEYLSRPADDPLRATERLVHHALKAQEGDLLVFLPGKGEIARLAERLEQAAIPAQIHALHGEMDAAAQARVLVPEPGHPRRVVLATDVAETSLTIEGITTVVDSGLARKPRFDPNTGLTRLVTLPVSRASARQRAGRAGRLGPGHCYRAWTEHEHERRPDRHPAEILQADLAPLALELALWGVQDPGDLTWIHPPPEAAWNQAVELLRRIQALDGSGRSTPHGREMAGLGLHPRLAHMLLRAGGSETAADLAALLSERDPWRPRPGEPRPADLALRLQALEAMRHKEDPGSQFDPAVLRRILALSRQLRRRVECRRENDLSPAALLALAWPERIARNRGGGRGRFLLASGRGAFLPEEDTLAGEALLAVAALDAGTREGRIWLAMELSREELEAAHGGRIQEREELYWDEEREQVRARALRLLDALELESRELPRPAGEAVTALLLEAIRHQGLERLQWPEPARQLLARIRLARRLDPGGGWPELEEPRLLETLEEWLAPWLEGLHRMEQVRGLPWEELFGGLLGWEMRQRLDALLPPRWRLPDGGEAPIDYLHDPPRLAVAVQRLYGSTRTPALYQGRMPLLLQLLSPAGRPLQQTRDLAHFWHHGWETVRKEMRGRYPKHHWPEDPARARPVRLKRQL